jgi:hypothetical protein
MGLAPMGIAGDKRGRLTRVVGEPDRQQLELPGDWSLMQHRRTGSQGARR